METVEKFLSSPIIFSIIVAFLLFYGPRLAPRMSEGIHEEYFKNPIFRFVVIFVLLYMATRYLSKGYFSGIGEQSKGEGKLVLIVLIFFFIIISTQTKKEDGKLLYKEPFSMRGTPNDFTEVNKTRENKWAGHSLSDTLQGNVDDRLSHTLNSPESPLKVSQNEDECLVCPPLDKNEKSLNAEFYDADPQPIDYSQVPEPPLQGTETKLWDGSEADMNSLRSYEKA